MREEADVDIFADERVVADTRVIRVRGRYAWPNGSGMEVEITDLGNGPSDVLLRSLGFQPALADSATEEGFSLQVEAMNEPGNFEYHYQTGEGRIQLLVADRFLVEVQLALLPEESFGTVIEHQVPIALLREMVEKRGAKP